MRTTWIRAAAVTAAASAATLAGVALPPPALAQEAPAPSGADVAGACAPLEAVPAVGRRVCQSLETGTRLAAQACRRLPGTEEQVCPVLDGRPTGEAAMAAHGSGWASRALDLQHRLDRDVPLVDALLPHTHNSANSGAYDPSVSTLDANQVVSLTDQLRLGIRAVELDLHWAPHPTGDPAAGFRRVVQCHGQSVGTGTPLGALHVGCSVDQPLGDRLGELRAWLDANPDEVVLLYLENVLDGDPAAHAEAVALLDEHLGGTVHRPAVDGDDACESLPATTLSKADVLAGGTQVVIVGNCGPAGWDDWVFDRYPAWDESGDSTGFDCTADRAATAYGEVLVRRWEDSTWLSTLAGGGSQITPAVLAEMVRCGVNLPGLDQIHPGDDRLPALVWSWRTDEPAPDAAGRCAAQGPDARFFAADCAEARPAACRTADGGWAVTAEPVPWAQVDAACTGAGHVGAGTPVNGPDNAELRAAAGSGEVWLAYAQDTDGAWVLGGPGTDPDPGTDPEPDGPGRGHRGRPPVPGPPAGVPAGPDRAVALAAAPASSDRPGPAVPLLASGILAGVAAVAGFGTRGRRA